jgi:hypothetical protein
MITSVTKRWSVRLYLHLFVYRWVRVVLCFCVCLCIVMSYMFYHMSLRSEFRIKLCSVNLYLQLFVGGLRSYLRYLCLLAYSGVQHILTIWVTWWLSYKRQELFALREHIGSPLVVDGVCVAHLFSFLCCVFCFVCLCPLSCVPNIVSLSGLFILDYHFGIL